MDSQAVQDEIQAHVEKGNYHAAINIAISAMNENRRNQNQPGIDQFLEVIQNIVNIMSDEFGSKP